MTTIRTAIRFFRFGFAVTLLGTGMLISAAPAGHAAEIAPTTVSATAPQSQNADAPAQTQPAQITLPLTGATGFGWG